MSKVHLGNPKTGHPTCGQKASYGTHNLRHVTCQRCGSLAKRSGYSVTCNCMLEPDNKGTWHVATHSGNCPEYLA